MNLLPSPRNAKSAIGLSVVQRRTSVASGSTGESFGLGMGIGVTSFS